MDIKSIGMRSSAWWRDHAALVLDGLRILAAGALFFGSGILYAQHFLFSGQSFTLQQSQGTVPPLMALPDSVVSTSSTVALTGPYVASRNGTKYYKTACGNRIADANKIYFQTEGDAKKAGYLPSVTCFK